MKTPSTLRHRLRQSTRDAILEAAATAFNGQGAAAARMEDIAAGAGIAVGTLYNYFRDRSALVSAVLQSRTQGLLDALDEAVADAARDVDGGPFRRRPAPLRRHPDPALRCQPLAHAGGDRRRPAPRASTRRR